MAKLGEIATYINGYPFKPEDWSSEGVPIIRIQDLSGNSYQSNRYNGEYAPKYEVDDGDVLISWSASLGVYIWHGEKAVLNQHIFKVIFDKVEVDKSFFVHQVSEILEKAATSAHGATMKHLTKPVFDALPFYLPTIDEQRRIAAILDKVTDLIAKRRAQLDKLDLLVKSRFVEMFGEPIANPMQWSVKSLKELSSLITNGNTPKGGSRNYVDDGIIFLRSQNVWRNQIILDDVAHINEKTHKELQKSSLHNKDILITKTGRINTENSSLGRAALFLGKNDSANINGHVYLVRLKDMIVPEYVVTILTGEAYRKYIRKVSVGGIDKRQINIEQVENFPIILPPVDMQNDFAVFRNHIFKVKKVVQRSLCKLEIMKKLLVQQYFV